ncbi:NmrA family NAD(P)-binding protein [Streptomyces luteolus]|uniref:NmrA family NAD(P)-binding protein n=1 Tax=Streptomyces luteolus TaxID=3043615 RepID=A0ABT6T859_9ACTN|nr:NmrA family NAD(P)-binding protein [Streptomyces sp. B-S-A12]MDI3424082.1 NmrA family NAD(P)-binding protein [Streptomyces sp. B-S-A12]
MSNADSVLVIGATGNQGGATAEELLSRGWSVRAMVRNPDKPEARELARRSAVLVQGGMDDEASLRRAMTGVQGVFSVQALAYDPATLAAEVRQGKAVAGAAQATGDRALRVQLRGRRRTRHRDRPLREQGRERAAHPEFSVCPSPCCGPCSS